MVFGLTSKKQLNETIAKFDALQQELDAFKEQHKKRIAESTYLFSGDLTPGTVGDTKNQRADLNTADYWSLQKQCYDIFKIHPYAKRVIEMMTDFVIGAELTFTVGEEIELKYSNRITPIIDDFWNDYDNNFDLMLEGMLNEYFVLGEQIYPVSVNDITKIVKLGIIDARMVEKILRHPLNSKRLYKIILNQGQFSKTPVYGVINEVDGKLAVDPLAQEQSERKTGSSYSDEEYMGEAFLFQINRLPTQTRGYSELSTMVESLDLMDQFIFQATEKSLLSYQFIADVLIKNADAKQIADFPVPDPRKNAVFKHNQNVEMKLHTPDIKAIEADKLVRMVTRFVLAGCGIPEHWIVNGENTNLATAREQNNPIEKRLRRKQGNIKYMLKTMIRYQLEQRMANVTPEEMTQIMKEVNIDFPSVSGVDRKVRAQVMTETAKSLVVAVQQGWVTSTDAGQEFINLANQFDMKLSAMHLKEKDQDEIEGLTGKKMKNGEDLDAYFKAVDKLTKQLDKEPEVAPAE